MKRNHSLLEYTRDNDTQVCELGPSGPSCFLTDSMKHPVLRLAVNTFTDQKS